MHDTKQAQEPAPALAGLLDLMLMAAFPHGLPAGLERAEVLAAMAERLAAARPELGAHLSTDDPELDAETRERARHIRQVLEARILNTLRGFATRRDMVRSRRRGPSRAADYRAQSQDFGLSLDGEATGSDDGRPSTDTTRASARRGRRLAID